MSTDKTTRICIAGVWFDEKELEEKLYDELKKRRTPRPEAPQAPTLNTQFWVHVGKTAPIEESPIVAAIKHAGFVLSKHAIPYSEWEELTKWKLGRYGK